MGARCPTWLTVGQRELWRKYAPIYEAVGVLTKADELAFANWMVIQDQIRRIVKAGNEPPTTLFNEAKSHAVQFGGTPSGRSRVHVEPKKPESKLARLMKGDS